MQRPPPRIKMHKSNSQKHLQVCSLVPANVIVLTIVLAQLMVLTHPTWAWQYADNQQVFPNRHPDFYHPPSNPITSNQFSLNTQNLYNQPLNSPLQQQFLTPTSSNNGQPPPTASDQLASSEPFSALFAPNSRISSSPATTSEQQQQHQPIVAAAASDASANSVHEQPINARDTSQQAKPIDTTNSQIKSNQEHDDHQHSSSGKQDHDVVVQSPSPLGKILDVVARETVSALSSSIAASKETSATTTTTKDAKQQTTTVAEGKVTHATKSESDSGGSGKRQANEQVLLHLKPLTQAVAMAAQQAKTKKSDKNSVNSIEQQIINQHARATSYATLHSRRYEPPQQQQQTTTATVPQQLVRLLPTKHRGDTKLFSNLLSTLSGHNSAASGGGDADSSSSQSGGSGGQLASLVDNFKSGISSRSSLVKAAISDNKLARTLSTVGKTIGGNKYVASAGAAAALAALGLTVSKFLSPYVMAGSYSKLGGAGPMDPLVAAGSYLQPSYMTTGGGGGGYGPGPDRNFHYLPTSDSMLAAAATNNNQQYLDSAQFDPNAMSQLQSAFNSYASQQQPDQLTSSPTGTGNFYAAYRPSSGTTTGSLSSQQKNAASFDGGANGHYSSFYSSQPEYEQQNGSGGLVDMSGQQQQFGSYISGAPTSGGFAAGQQYGTVATSLPAGSSSGGDPTGYFSSDQTDLSSAVSATGNTYEPTLGQQQQYDQIMSSASSDTPTYANNLLGPQPQPPSRVSFPKSATSAGSWAAGRAPQHRSGAVVLKLDEATRNLIRQQLQAELAARAASTNYNYLTLNSASRSGGSGTGADQSSGEMTATSGSEFTATPPVVSMTDQRVGAADSSGDYATFVQWQPQSSSIVAQAQQQQGGGVRSGTIKSNYNGAQQSTGQTWPHLRQQGQFVVAGAGGQQADKKLQLANYNSIRPQMQTRRNEPSAAASNAHVLIRPNTMRPHTAPPPPPVDSSPASRKPGQQLARAQPQLVPIVGTSTRSLSSTATQWNSVQASKQADQMAAGDKKLPAATVGSLDLPQASGATAAEFANDDDPKTSTSGLSLNRAARNPQAAGRMAAPEAERANNSWLVPAIDQQSLLRDYEVLAAAQQQQQQPPVDGVSPQQVSGKSGHSTTTASQQDDELLQVASSMRANLIQSSDGDRPQSSTDATDGAEYQLDTLDGGGEIEENNNSTSDNKTGQEGNKLIEAKTNTNNAAIVVADGSGGGKRSSGQHDKRHRSHSPSMSSQQQQQHRATTTAGEGDNVPASVLSATEQRQEQVTLLPPATTTATTVDQQQQTLSSRLSQVVGGGGDDEDQTKYREHRAFRGIVAGGLGGAGH